MMRQKTRRLGLDFGNAEVAVACDCLLSLTKHADREWAKVVNLDVLMEESSRVAFGQPWCVGSRQEVVALGC